jgi:hypothetical protein
LIARVDLLVIDDWATDRSAPARENDLPEIIEDRCANRVIITTTNLPFKDRGKLSTTPPSPTASSTTASSSTSRASPGGPTRKSNSAFHQATSTSTPGAATLGYRRSRDRTRFPCIWVLLQERSARLYVKLANPMEPDSSKDGPTANEPSMRQPFAPGTVAAALTVPSQLATRRGRGLVGEVQAEGDQSATAYQPGTIKVPRLRGSPKRVVATQFLDIGRAAAADKKHPGDDVS